MPGLNVIVPVGTGSQTINGTAGDDLLYGGPGDDTLIGDDGSDILEGLGGADVLNGGADADTVRYWASLTGVSVSLVTNLGQFGDAEGDQLISIENLVGSSFDDTLVGDDRDNGLTGWDGADQLFGGGGSDRLSGLLGADALDGGAGFDLALYTRATSSVAVDLSTGLGTAGEADGDTLTDVEGLIGSGFADTLTGDDDANRLVGGGGDDHLTGLGDNDTLVGGAGADTLDGGAGFDTVNYSQSSDQVIINVRTGVHMGVDALGDELISIERVVGTDFADSIVLGDLDNKVVAGAGGDFVDSGDGNDTIVGGAGADFLHGGQGTDWASYWSSPSGVTIGISGVGVGGDAQGDVLSSIDNISGSAFDDVLTGSRLDNLLWGLAGDDSLIGGDGDDRLIGHAGRDTLTGDGGADRFVLRGHDTYDERVIGESDPISLPVDNPSDVVTDFEAGVDELVLDGTLFDARTLATGSDPTALGLSGVGDSTFTLSDDVLYHVTEIAAVGGVRQFEVETVVELAVTGSFDISDISFF